MFCANLGAVLGVSGGGGGGTDYWYLVSDISGAAGSVDIFSAGSIAVGGHATANYFIVSAAGAVTTSKTLTPAGLIASRSIAVSGTDIVYASNDATNRPVVLKDTAAGVNVWDTGISGLSGSGVRGTVVDSTGAVIFNYLNSAGTAINIVKLSSAGALVWQRAWTYPAIGAVYASNGRNICVDGSDNIIVNVATGGFTPSIHILKLDSAGNTVWMRKYTDGNLANAMLPFDMACSSAGVVAIVGTTTVGGISNGLLFTLSSGGALGINARVNPGTNNILEFKGVDIDTEGSIYVAGVFSTGTSSLQYGSLIKFTAAGAISWQNRWYATSNSSAPTGFLGVSVAGSNLVAVGLDQLSSTKQCVLNVPPDGTLLGVYGAYTYAATSLTLGTLTDYVVTSGTASVGTIANTLSAFTGVLGTGGTGSTLTDIPFSGGSPPSVILDGWIFRTSLPLPTGAPTIGCIAAKDSLGNYFLVSSIQDSNGLNSGTYVQKVTSAGTELWQINYAAANPMNAVCDSTGNLYVLGYTYDRYYVIKLSGLGTLLWQYIYGNSTPLVTQSEDICIDANGDILFVTAASSHLGGNVVKLSPSGSVIWQKALTTDRQFGYPKIATDSLNNIYVTNCQTISGYGNFRAYLTKLSSAGNLISALTIPVAPQINGAIIVWTDSADNYYLCINGNIVKYTSSGTAVWSVNLQMPSSFSSYTSGYVDSATGVTYVLGLRRFVTTAEALVVAIDAGGFVSWSNDLDLPGGDAIGYKIVSHSSSEFIISVFGGQLTFIYSSLFKLPTDGGKLGTYSPFTYTTSSATITSPGDPTSPGTTAVVTSTLPFVAAAGAVTTSTLTSVLIDIP